MHSLRGCRREPLLTQPGSAQPVLKHDETEQELVVILPPRSMVLHKFPYWPGFEQIKHERAFINEHFGKRAVERRAKPFVHDVHRETALLPLENARRQVTLADPPVQPFALPSD